MRCANALLLIFLFLLYPATDATTAPRVAQGHMEQATFAGGCFWCMQHPFDGLEGVISTTVGYAGGHGKNPTYEEVSAGRTGHAESVQIKFNPSKVSYQQCWMFSGGRLTQPIQVGNSWIVVTNTGQ